VALLEATPLPVRTLCLIEGVESGRGRNQEALLVCHVLDEVQPLLFDVEGLDTLVLEALQVGLADVGVHGADLVG